MKTLLIGALMGGLTISAASAQTADQGSAGATAPSAGARSGNITSTGATVPNPGASQSAGTTALDRGIQSEDNKIDSGICKGC